MTHHIDNALLLHGEEPEPFGYFKAEPFGWTDCAETDDGAIALYTAPPAPSVPDGDLSEARRIVEQQRGEIERLQQEVTMLRQEYAAMLYALAAEMRREEGCVTESPELVEQAATRLDEQTVAINELRRQRGVLLDALHVALPFVEDHEGDQCYKAGAVAKAVASIKSAIAQAEGAGA